MRQLRLFFYCQLFLISPTLAQPENWKLVHEKTEARLREIAAGVRGAMGIAALDLTSGERFAIFSSSIFNSFKRCF